MESAIRVTPFVLLASFSLRKHVRTDDTASVPVLPAPPARAIAYELTAQPGNPGYSLKEIVI